MRHNSANGIKCVQKLDFKIKLVYSIKIIKEKSMIKWFKEVLGITPQKTKTKAPAAKVPAKKAQRQKVAGGPAGKSAATAKKKQTKATLAKLTKTAIDDLAKAELKIELDRRKTKDALIKDYLAAQKK